MNITVERVAYGDVEALRGLYRQEANCQIVGDSALARGLADPYLLRADGRLAAYGAVWNRYSPGRVHEFYALPHARPLALPLFRELLDASGATGIEAQTNIPRMLAMLYDCGTNVVTEKILFHDALATDLPCPPGATFRRAAPGDAASIFPHRDEPIGDWVIEDGGGRVVATGGFLCHYNPPYGDLYMEVAEHARRQGYGSYLIQELKRVCYEAGRLPSARCSPENEASRRTLERAGLLSCGRLLVGEVAPRVTASV